MDIRRAGKYKWVMKELFFRNAHNQIHCIDSERQSQAGLPPVVFLPGMLGRAEDWFSRSANLAASRRVIAISFRGRGKSSTPKEGFSLRDHVSDIETVFDGLQLGPAILIAHSRAVPYALSFSQTRPQSVAALVLLDHAPVHTNLGTNWSDFILASENWKEFSEETVSAMQAESDLVDLTAALSQLDCPVAYIAGRRGESILTEDNLSTYAKLLRRPFVMVEPGSGHELETLDLQFVLDNIES